MNSVLFVPRICRIPWRCLPLGWFFIIALALFVVEYARAGDAPTIATANLRVAKDFKAELLYNVPKDTEGSWVAMCVDNKGRLIVSDQYGKLYRIVPPPIGSSAPIQHEAIDLPVGQAHGLLYAFDSLYVMVNEDDKARGLYRVRDTDGDDRFDEVKLLRRLDGGGEHGIHAVLLSPDGKSLYIVCGDNTKLTQFDSSRVPRDWSEDHLLPRLWDGNGFMKGVLGPGGWIAKTDPDGTNWELIAVGFRNEFDAAFNRYGELFTYDADMEWDLNTPWYRPTRLNHVISGAEFGWRSGAGKWPAYYVDSFGAVFNVGPGSPTGLTFGYGAKFPARYQEALFMCDWSFGKLYATPLTPNGASYTAKPEEFVTGQPLALTDIVVNPRDGAIYFAVGGRRTQSALYRVTYIGNESIAPSKPDTRFAKERALRHQLEAFHGHKDPKAVATLWPHLKSQDRAIRYAARVALEWQDPAQWSQQALTAKDPRTAIAALVALSRVSAKDEFHRTSGDPPPPTGLQDQIVDALERIHWSKLSKDDHLDLLRAYSLAFIRLGHPSDATRLKLIARFDPLFPAATREENAELCQMLVYLESPNAATKLMAKLRSSPTQEEQIEYARALRVLKTGWTLPLREEYFQWFLKAANFKGGASLAGFMRNMKDDAVATLTAEERTALKPILDAKPQIKSPLQLLAERQFVKAWTVNELMPVVERGLKGGRNFDRGQKLFGAVACASCHRINNDGGAVGPDLTTLAMRFSLHDVLESIVEPSKEISDQYAAIVIRKKNGEVITGRVGNLNGDTLNVLENMFAPNDFTDVKRSDIDSIQPSKVSMMPEGLLNSLKEDEIEDLVAFLLSRGDRQNKMFR
jgi:putative heme-binding domain-containing protein